MDNQPKEILEHILRYLPNQELIFLTRVSKEWKNIIENRIFHQDVVPSFEECIVTKNYFYGRRYLNQQLYHRHVRLIKFIDDKIFMRHFNIPNISVSKNSLFVEYSEYGHVNIIKYLIEIGADIHVTDDDAFCRSAKNGHIEVVKLLLEKGADIHADNDFALYWSAKNGHFEVVKLLLEKRITIHPNNDVLCISALNGRTKIVKLLLENGADINTLPFYLRLKYGSFETKIRTLFGFKKLKK